MASRNAKRSRSTAGTPSTSTTRPAPSPVRRTASRGGPVAAPGRRRLLLGSGLVAALVVVGLGAVILTSGRGPATASTGSTAGASVPGTVIQGNGGSWTNISSDTLASMLRTKDFTFLNVKTPYIGEIAGTDLYIPYTQLAARGAELPADKSARIVVYCRSGNESAIASQTLLDLGYTNILNLDGGMNAWTASGRQIVNRNRG